MSFKNQAKIRSFLKSCMMHKTQELNEWTLSYSHRCTIRLLFSLQMKWFCARVEVTEWHLSFK